MPPWIPGSSRASSSKSYAISDIDCAMPDDRVEDDELTRPAPARGALDPVPQPGDRGESRRSRPYARGMATGLGVLLAAGLVMAVADLVHAGGGLGALPPLLGLWSLIALPLALGAGIVLGAGNAQWGIGWLRRGVARLREDDALDRLVASLLVAVALVAGLLALVISKLAVALVANVHRTNVGALLLGVVVVALLPVLALGVLPVYRAVRRVIGIVPAIGPLSRVLVMVVVAAGALVLAALFVVFKKLDYQAMNLGLYVAPALLPVVAIAIGLLGYGPLARTREALPYRGIVATAGAAIAALAIAFGFRTPSVPVRTAVMQRSYIGPKLIETLRARKDHDGDGFSAFFGGPDCDDTRSNVNPKAPEIVGNGIDDNCMNGDAPAVPATATPDPRAPLAAQPPAKPTTSAGHNVLVLFVDTLRFDRLGVAGYRRDGKSLTPRVDALANQSVVFTHAYSQAPNTPRSVPSFLASRYPSQLAMDNPSSNYPQLGEANDFLFEALKGAGFRTIGETSHFFFCDRQRSPTSCEGVKASMNSNVWQGADEWDNEGAKTISDSNHDIAGTRIVEKTVARLARLGKERKPTDQFAMFVHLFEPHSTYIEHPGMPEVTEHGDDRLKRLYDYEIAAEDGFIGQILDGLEASGLAKDTTVVLLSDHGEAFGVHRFGGERQYFHGSTLYDELLHVPLMIRVPGGAPREVTDVVELVDMAPTVTALFGVAAPATWQGHSLVPLMEGAKAPAAPAYAEMQAVDEWNHDAKSMVTADGKYHVFYSLSDSVWELYDLAADPEERKNVMDTDPRAAEIKRQIGQWVEGPLAAGGGR